MDKENHSPDCFSSWEACWLVVRTVAIMCDLARPAVLDRHAAKFRALLERFQDELYLCVLADTRCRSEHWDAAHRRQAQFHESTPVLSAFVSSPRFLEGGARGQSGRVLGCPESGQQSWQFKGSRKGQVAVPERRKDYEDTARSRGRRPLPSWDRWTLSHHAGRR